MPETQTEPKLRRYDEVIATFQPKRTDDLKPGVVAYFGHRGRWQVAWRITEEDGGSYVGQWALAPWDVDERFGWLGWAPEEDFRDIVIVDRLEDGGR